MAQSEPHMDKTSKSTAQASIFADLGETGQQGLKTLVAAQAEFFNRIQELNQYWLARAKSEAELTSDLFTKLISTRSVPEGATACQEWSKRRMEMAVEDGQRLFADSLKLMETSARLFANGGANRRV
jgi:hypothetical protein